MIGVLGEGAGHMGHPVVPQPARAEIGLPGPVMDLPTDGAFDRLWQYFSTDGFPKIPIGNSTFDIPAVDDLRGGMAGFPDKASVEKLRYYGIKTVVLHTDPDRACRPADGNVDPRAARPGRRRRQADRRPGHHAPARRLGRDLPDRPRAEGPAWTDRRPDAACSAERSSRRRRLARRDPARGLAFATVIQSFSWNQTSHYDLIRSLNNDHTTIDPYQANTGDKVFYKGHYYSARAPGLALFSLPFYDALNLVNAESWTRAHVAPPSAAATR